MYMTKPSFTLRSSKGHPQILSNLDLERLTLLLRTCFVHVNQESIRIVIDLFYIFGSNVHQLAFFGFYKKQQNFRPMEECTLTFNVKLVTHTR